MKVAIIFCSCLLLYCRLAAQKQISTPLSFEGASRDYFNERISTLIDDGLLAEDARRDCLERYESLLEQPLDINEASQEDLLSIPFMSEYLAYQLIHYRTEHHGIIGDISELKTITGWDDERFIAYVYPLLRFNTPDALRQKKQNFWAGASGRLTALLQRPIAQASNKYIGSPEGVSLGLFWSKRGLWSIFLGADKDSYEPWRYQGHRGFDSYHGHIALESLGLMKRLIVGQYRASWAEGLVLSQSFRQPSLLTNRTSTYRYTPSRGTSNYNIGQGVLIELGRSRGLSLSTLFSQRPLDAGIKEEDYVSSVASSGLHRTALEWSKRHQLRETYYGLRLAWTHGAWTLSLQGLYYQWGGKRLRHAMGASYRESLDGLKHFANASLAYHYRSERGRLKASGEFAQAQNKSIATNHTLYYQGERLGTLALSVRYIAPDYWAYLGHARSHYAYPNNEMGLGWGFHSRDWWRGVDMQLEGDFYQSVKPRRKGMIERGTYVRLNLEGHLTSLWTWRLRTAYRYSNVASSRLHFAIGLKSQGVRWIKDVQATIVHSNVHKSLAYAISTRLSYQLANKTRAWLSLNWYRVDHWQQRIYIYENQLQREYSNVWLYGRGLGFNVGLKHQINKAIGLGLRFSRYQTPVDKLKQMLVASMDFRL